MIGVSAVPFGKGAEFRKWRITDIRLAIGTNRVKPGQTNKFFVKKESFWKYPSAVLFAVIGAQMPAAGSNLDRVITRTGAAIGLGILTLAAEGDIAGERCIFNLDSARADRIIEGVDAIVITVENADIHRKETIAIGLARSPAATVTCDECAGLDQPGLKKLADDLAGEAKALETRQSALSSRSDPQYDVLQREIDRLETKRGIAYKMWLERGGVE